MVSRNFIKKFFSSNFPSRPISRHTILFFVLTILCSTFVLWNATRTGEQSGNLSGIITDSIKDNIESNNSIPPSLEGTDAINSKAPSNVDDKDKVSVNAYYLDIFIRKSAHLIEYTVLTFFAALTFFSAGVHADKSFKKSIFFGSFIAITDEILQSFTEGRTGKFSDVLIDICGCVMGAFFAISIFVFIFLFLKSYKTSNRRKNSKENKIQL